MPLRDLVFDTVDWTLQQEHVEQRAGRKGTVEYEPKVEHATEACQDPRRLTSRTTAAVIVVGYSRSAGRVLRVILQPVGHASEGEWTGLTAHAAGSRDRNVYEQD